MRKGQGLPAFRMVKGKGAAKKRDSGSEAVKERKNWRMGGVTVKKQINQIRTKKFQWVWRSSGIIGDLVGIFNDLCRLEIRRL